MEQSRIDNIETLYSRPERGPKSYGRTIDDLLQKNIKTSLRWGNPEIDFIRTFVTNEQKKDSDFGEIVNIVNQLIQHRLNGVFDGGMKFS